MRANAPGEAPQQSAGAQSVRAGDYGGSLERIARAQLGPNATQGDINNYVGQLFELNGITNPRAIQPGQTIVLPDAATPAASSGLARYGKDIAFGEQQKAELAARRAVEYIENTTTSAPGVVPTNEVAAAAPAESRGFWATLAAGARDVRDSVAAGTLILTAPVMGKVFGQEVQDNMFGAANELLQQPGETSAKSVAVGATGVTMGVLKTAGDTVIGLGNLALLGWKEYAYQALGGDYGLGTQIETLRAGHEQVLGIGDSIASGVKSFASDVPGSVSSGYDKLVGATTNFFENTATAFTSTDYNQGLQAGIQAGEFGTNAVATATGVYGLARGGVGLVGRLAGGEALAVEGASATAASLRASRLAEAESFLINDAKITDSAYRAQIIKSFGDDIRVGEYSGQAYQYSGFKGSTSQYLTPNPVANPIQELALPSRNPAAMVQQYGVESTRALMGTVAPQNYGAGLLTGGVQQIFVPSRSVLSPTLMLPR
jgi:hypothetical protein